MSFKMVKKGTYTYKRVGAFKTSYRVRYHQGGINLDESLDDSGPFDSDNAAVKEARKRILRATQKKENEDLESEDTLVRCEELCQELIKLRTSKSASTLRQANVFFNQHMIPWLNIHCPIASELNTTHWLHYKNDKRLNNPKVSLFGHWKFWRMLVKYAHEKGILKSKLKLEYDPEKEDFRAEGLVIPIADLRALLKAATPDWKDRILIGRLTGMRPGEIRNLLKDRYHPMLRMIMLKKEDTKTRKARSFIIESDLVLEILNRRLKANDSPYFFPNRTNKNRPLSHCLRDWHRIRAKAGLSTHYTPHDLRHTYLTEMFKTDENPALICFQAGLSLEEALETYLHFKPEDTVSLSQKAAKNSMLTELVL